MMREIVFYIVFFIKFDFDPDLGLDPDPGWDPDLELDPDPELSEKSDPDPEIIFSDPTHLLELSL